MECFLFLHFVCKQPVISIPRAGKAPHPVGASGGLLPRSSCPLGWFCVWFGFIFLGWVSNSSSIPSQLFFRIFLNSLPSSSWNSRFYMIFLVVQPYLRWNIRRATKATRPVPSTRGSDIDSTAGTGHPLYARRCVGWDEIWE